MELEHGTLRMPGKRHRGKLKLKQSSYRTYQRDVRIVKDHCAQNFMDIYQNSERKLSGVEEYQFITALKRAKKRLRKYWRLVHTRDALHGTFSTL